MRRLIRSAARLYPSAWRKRYGVEFAAVLDDVQPTPRILFDVMKGAALMQVTNFKAIKVLTVSGLLGALAALGISYVLPRTYVSEAVIKVTSEQPVSLPWVLGRVSSVSEAVRSRVALARTINAFSLYPRERMRIPIEDVIERMRKDIEIRPIAGLDGSTPPAFAVQFSYPDRLVAQRVTQDLTARFIEENVRGRSESPLTLELLDAASLPVNSESPGPSQLSLVGLATGLALGSAGVVLRRSLQGSRERRECLEKTVGGTLIIRGTSVPVNALFEYLESDKNLSQFLTDFPAVSRAAAVSVLRSTKP